MTEVVLPGGVGGGWGHVSGPEAPLGFSFSPCRDRELPAVTEKFRISIWLEMKSHRRFSKPEEIPSDLMCPDLFLEYEVLDLRRSVGSQCINVLKVCFSKYN